MSEQELTPWFPASVKPARSGVYQTSDREQGGRGEYFSYFDGELWHGEWWSVERATTQPSIFGITPERLASTTYWRGLAKEPK